MIKPLSLCLHPWHTHKNPPRLILYAPLRPSSTPIPTDNLSLFLRTRPPAEAIAICRPRHDRNRRALVDMGDYETRVSDGTSFTLY
jgi:hypothetical protein